jgi:hypothetical protein
MACVFSLVLFTGCPPEEPKKAEYIGDAFRDEVRESLFWLHDSLFGKAEIYDPHDPIYSSVYPDSACEARRLEFMAIADSIQHIADAIQPILANAYRARERAIMKQFNSYPWIVRRFKTPPANAYKKTGDSIFDLYCNRLERAVAFSGDTVKRKLH